MDEIRYSLCPNCDACPEVVIAEGSVVIGEAGNQVRLSSDEWNVLVEAVKTGTLSPIVARVATSSACGCACGCED